MIIVSFGEEIILPPFSRSPFPTICEPGTSYQKHQLQSISTFFNFAHPRLLSGAPNENIVQNHLNIEFFNVFKYLNDRTGIFLSPKIFHLFGFPS